MVAGDRDGSGRVACTTGITTTVGNQTKLIVTLDLRSAKPGSYFLLTELSGQQNFYSYPLNIQWLGFLVDASWYWLSFRASLGYRSETRDLCPHDAGYDLFCSAASRRTMNDEIMREMSPVSDSMYARCGRPSIPF
jgi:hypothetical protein